MAVIFRNLTDAVELSKSYDTSGVLDRVEKNHNVSESAQTLDLHPPPRGKIYLFSSSSPVDGEVNYERLLFSSRRQLNCTPANRKSSLDTLAHTYPI